MEFVNVLYKNGANREDLIVLAKLLKPFAPHLASEMLEKLDSDDVWPTWDESLLQADEVQIIVQINGKLRARVSALADETETEEQLTAAALDDDKVKSLISGKQIVKTIAVVKSHLVNIVVK